jgi:site-specific DNA recombinase
MRAAIYVRESLNRGDESSTLERQEQLCRQYADAYGWEVAGLFKEWSASGWKRGAKRPEWDKVLQKIERHEVDVLIAYSLSRLGRRARDLLVLDDYLKEHDCRLVLINEKLDTSTPAGRMFYLIVAGFAELESDTISERVRSDRKMKADNGAMHDGGLRRYGYNRKAIVDNQPVIVPDPNATDGSVCKSEAAVIKDATKRVMNGETLGSICKLLNERKVSAVEGGQWSSARLGALLRAPHIAGIRVHNERRLPGGWEPILSEAQWSELCAELDSRTVWNGDRTSKHLLAGLIRCGICGRPMTAKIIRKDEKTFERYSCSKREGSTNCGTIAVSKPDIEYTVYQRWIVAMSDAHLKPTDDDASVSLDDLETIITATEDRIKILTHDRYVIGKVDDAAYDAAYGALSAVLDSARAAQVLILTAAPKAPPLPLGDVEALEDWWMEADQRDRRKALASAIEGVLVSPAPRRGGRVFNPNRVSIVWSDKTYDGLATKPDGLNYGTDEAGNLYRMGEFQPVA